MTMMRTIPAADHSRHNHALRIAFVITAGLVFETLRGAMLPPMAAVIAMQLVALSRVPPKPVMAIVMLAIIGLTSLVTYSVSYLTSAYAITNAMSIALLYLWGFYLCFNPKTAPIGPLVLMMIIVVSALSAASNLLAGIVIMELLTASAIGIVLAYLSHALFPNRLTAPKAVKPDIQGPFLSPARRAGLAMLIIMPLHLYLTSDGVAAMVILITTATMLQQPRLADSTRYSINFALGNAAGASLAAINATILATQNTLPLAIAIIAASALLLALQIVRGPRSAAVFIPGCVGYTMLFGLTLSTLPITDDVAVTMRVAQIVTAAVYALCAISLIYPLLRARQRGAPAV